MGVLCFHSIAVVKDEIFCPQLQGHLRMQGRLIETGRCYHF